MRRLVCLAGLTAMASGTAAAPVNLSPAGQRDVHCFMLFAVAVNQAADAKDAQTQQATSLALTYYLGKLAVTAPNLQLADAIKQEAGAFKDETAAKAIGDGCNAEFARAGAQLHDLEQAGQKPAPAPAPKK
jgi:hypothetical protein